MSYYPGMMSNPNILPPQQVLQANGRTSINALRMSPNSSALIMDTTAPIVWLCISDSIGNVTSTPYDISVHEERSTTETDLEQRLGAVETTLSDLTKRLEVLTSAKPNDKRTKPE